LEGSCEHGNELSVSKKILGSSWVDERLAASQEGLSSMELIMLLAVGIGSDSE
jgi:hypothetical protein